LTGTDDAAIRPLPVGSQPLDGPLPDVFASFDDEFFVEWQVADIAPAAPVRHVLLR
jgi:hypothetical protein